MSDRRVTWVGLLTLYVALTVAYAWPVLASIDSVLPNDTGDPGLNAWILWWNSQAVPFTQRWWDAPIFFPVRGTFALSETMLGLTPLTTPLHWMGASAVTVYNVAFLISFPATALAAHALARQITGRHDAALVAGLAFGFNPYRASQIPHLQMLWAMWMPLCLWALHRYLDTRRASALVIAGVAWVLNGLTCGYYLMYFAVLAGLWVLWFARTRRDWVAIVGTLALASLLLAPALIGYQRHQRSLGLSRSVEEIETFSADLTGFWAAQENVWLPAHWTFRPRSEGELYPGGVILLLSVAGAAIAWYRNRPTRRRRLPLVLAGCGILVGLAAIAAWNGGWERTILGVPISLTRPVKALFTAACLLILAMAADSRAAAAWKRRSPLLFYCLAAVAMVLCALGPTGHAFDVKFLYDAPYSWLMMLPGGHALRVPARFAMLCALCLSVAASIAFSRMRRTRAPAPLLLALGIVILADGWIPAFITAPVSPATLVIPSAERGLPLLEWPLYDVFTETAVMLRATTHRHPLFNGFSGYTPAHYNVMVEALNSRDRSAFAALQSFGPMLVVVDRSMDPDEVNARFLRDLPGATQIARTPIGLLFRLPGIDPPPADPELAVSYVEANSNPGNVAAMLDRDLTTIWQTVGPQSSGHQVVLVFERPVAMSSLEFDLGGSRSDYPRRLAIDVTDPGRPPARVWEGPTSGAALLGAIVDRTRLPVVIPLPGKPVGRRFTLTILASDETYFWTIAELHAYGRVP